MDITFDPTGGGTCRACGGGLHKGQWDDPSPPSTPALLGLILWPFIVALLLIGGGLMAVGLSWRLYETVLAQDPTASFLPRIARFIGTFPGDLVRLIDLAGCVILIAIATRIYRTRLARYYDRSVRCRRCGHDLRGTPTEQGLGLCGECGTPFVRLTSTASLDECEEPAPSASEGPAPPETSRADH